MKERGVGGLPLFTFTRGLGTCASRGGPAPATQDGSSSGLMAIRGGPSQTAAGRGSGGEGLGLRAPFLKSTGVRPRFATRPSRPLQKTRHTEDASVAHHPAKPFSR